MSLGLAGRLRAHKSINVDVRSTAASLMQGVFGGMVIKGHHWETPLSLTADTIEVDIGELLLDYGTLITQSSVALRNLPTGSCKFRLSSEDLGRFFSHPMLRPAAAKAINGKAFLWDCASVVIAQDAVSGLGFIDLEGDSEADGERYKVRMIPTKPEPTGAGTGGASASHGLKVSAKRVAPPASASLSPIAVEASRAVVDSSVAEMAVAAAARREGSAAVARGLATVFSSLQLNLQGIELRQPSLHVVLPGADGNTTGYAMLDISMKMRIRNIPPLDMNF